ANQHLPQEGMAPATLVAAATQAQALHAQMTLVEEFTTQDFDVLPAKNCCCRVCHAPAPAGFKRGRLEQGLLQCKPSFGPRLRCLSLDTWNHNNRLTGWSVQTETPMHRFSSASRRPLALALLVLGAGLAPV